MGDYTIHLKDDSSYKSYGNPSRVTQSSPNDDASLVKLSESIKESNKELLAKMGSDLDRLISKTISNSPTTEHKDIDISKIVSDTSKALSETILKNIISSLPKNPGKEYNQSEISVAIEKKMQKSVQGASQTISDKLGAKGISIDTKSLEDGINNAVKQVVPKNIDSAVRDLTSAASSIKAIVRDIGRIASAISNMRNSGGKVDVSEMGAIYSATKQIFNDARTVTSEIKKAKDSVAELHGESSEIKKNMNEAMDAIQSRMKEVVIGVQSSAKEDPRNFSREVIQSLVELVKKSDVTKDSSTAKAIAKIETDMSNMTDAITFIKTLPNNIRSDYKEGKLNSESVEKLIKLLGAFQTSIGSLPMKMDVSYPVTTPQPVNKPIKQPPTEVKAIEVFNKGLDGLRKAITLVVNDKELTEISDKKIRVDVDLGVNPDVIESTIDNAIAKAAKREVKLKVTSVLSDNMSSASKFALSARDQSSDFAKEIESYNNGSNASKSQRNKSTSVEDVNITRVRGQVATVRATDKAMYKADTINPYPGGYVKSVSTIRALSDDAAKIKATTEANVKKLSASLYDLQYQLIDNLSKQLKESQKDWVMNRPSNNPDPTSAFKLVPGGRQWAADMVNDRVIRKAMGDFKSPIDVVTQSYKDKLVNHISSNYSGTESMSNAVGMWLKSTTNGQIKGMTNIDEVAKSNLIRIKDGDKGIAVGEAMRKAITNAFGSGDGLRSIFKNTFADVQADKDMRSRNYVSPDGLVKGSVVKSISIPAATVSETGDATFQTVHGALRSLPKFAKFQTGFEVLHKELEDAQAYDATNAFGGRIKSIGIRPGADKRVEANQLSSEMLSAVSDIKGVDYIKNLYSEAAKFKGIDVENSTQGAVKSEDFVTKISSAITSFDKSSNKSISTLMKVMESNELNPYDVVKSLNKVEVMNAYDVMGNILKGNNKVSPIKDIAESPGFDQPIRDFEKAIRDVEGLMPLMETNRPRRGYHQENTVNLLTRTSSLYDQNYTKLGPDDQKSVIKDLNIELTDTLKKLEKIRGGASELGIVGLSSIGIPEAQAGDVEEYRPKNGTSSKYLNTLNATSFKMYGEDLTALAPFKQFQQAGRNISNVTNAMTNMDGGAEFPKLRSERERALIESGRYGTKGYGYNVVAELKNTASNFEDQIVISGKLANALTTAVSSLIKPGASGRVGSSATVSGMVTSTGVTEIKAGHKLVDSKDVGNVSRKYMEILGMPEEYDGRADKALIEAVEKTIAVVRGENVEVQKAKLAETFMAHFGRKLTTRYGSKGVSITPASRDGAIDFTKVLSKFGASPIKIDPSATLGFQAAPKSMGEMASELLGKNMNTKYKDKLKASGNKFMIDIFQDKNMVSDDEAEDTANLYKKFATAWEKKFGEQAPEVGVEGIKALRTKYTEKFGKGSDIKIKPIDVRVSSYGAAKRGLQTEFMESIFSNIAATGEGGYTTLKQFGKNEYDKLLRGGELANYSEALGYKGSGKTKEELAPELFKMFGGKGDIEKAYSGSDEKNREKAVLAKKAAALEAESKFYSDVVDEFGHERTGFVGEKFMQIIEEPHKNPAWERGQIESGVKGARFNVPAFSAYASVFGKDSSLMKEIQSSLDVSSKKHWEYMKALQAIQDKDSSTYKNLTSSLRSVDLSEVKGFDYSTGIYGEEQITDASGSVIENPRSFSRTIFDVDRFPEPFKLKIPTGRTTQTGEPEKEDFYIPGSIARQTYPDPLLAGEFGMDEISRRLSNVINSAKKLEDLMAQGEDPSQSDAIAKKIPSMINKWLRLANDLAKEDTPEATQGVRNIAERMAKALSKSEAPSKQLFDTGGRSEYEYIFGKERPGTKSGVLFNQLASGKTEAKALATTIGTMADIIKGKGSGGTIEQMNAPTALSRHKDAGTVGVLARNLGIDIEEEINKSINRALQSLQKAKIDYGHSIANTIVGKSGSVNELLLNRKIPSIIGKAVTGVTDKSKDLTAFRERLEYINKVSDIDLSGEIAGVGNVSLKHGKAIDEHRKAGIPVLRQDEVGIPSSYASKIPVSYEKKYSFGKNGMEKIKPETVDTTLDRMMEYVDKLKLNASKLEPGSAISKDDVKTHIEKDLVPYVESIRFPFTGTSSIAPFKPTLINSTDYMSNDGRPLAENSLIVPGVPEGMEGLAEVIASVQKKIDGLMEQREVLQTEGGTDEQINALTKNIRLLNAAISDVIPKYSAQAQKLDFDGDQIEIHSARTADARADISKHFDRFHRANVSKDIRTSDIYMQRFLSDAANIKTTGPYVFGESQAAFEKKFPSGKGFEFMRSPFLNESLDYLSMKQSLDVLSGNDQIGDVSNVIEDVLKGMNRPIGEVIDVLDKIRSYEGDDKTQGIVDIINESYGKTDVNKIESGVKKRLYESKVGDTVEAQLFKIHTGPENEGIYRIHRLAEEASGFSGGLIKSGKIDSTPYFKQRYPNLKISGHNPEEEFNTYINEISRFGIQKGMDVKHAGEKPVAGKIVNYLSRGLQGSEELWKEIGTDKQLGDLKDFAGDSEKAIRMRLGEMPTDDILAELTTLMESRGESTKGLHNLDRSELIKVVVNKIGLKGFLDEMAILIRHEAVDGLVKQANSWSDAKKGSPGNGMPPVGKDIRMWAEKVIDTQMNSGGIDIANTVSAAKTPLYNMRTFFASPGSEHKKYLQRYGKISVPAQDVSAMDVDSKSSYSSKYMQTTAVATNLKDELNAFSKTQQTGAYAEMTRGAIEELHKEQEEISNKATSILKEGYDIDSPKKVDLATRTMNMSDIPEYAKKILNMDSGKRRFEIERLSDLVGVPSLSDGEKRNIDINTSPVFSKQKRFELEGSGISESEQSEEEKKYSEAMVEKAISLKQLDRITDVILARRDEGMLLQDLMPSQTTGNRLPAESDKEMFDRVRSEIKNVNEKRSFENTEMLNSAGQNVPGSGATAEQTASAGGQGGFNMFSGGGMGSTGMSGDVVPVHIVSADPSVTINIRGLVGAGFIQESGGDMFSNMQQATTEPEGLLDMDSGLIDNIRKRSSVDEVLKTLKTKFGQSVSTEDYFTPSKLSGDWDLVKERVPYTEDRRMEEQLSGIVKSMTIKPDVSPAGELSSKWGTLLHAVIEKYEGAKDNVSIEEYGEMHDPTAGHIGGIADIVKYTSADKTKVSNVIDIKSTTPKKLAEIKKAISAAGSSNMDDVIANADDDIKRLLDDYKSQLNTYLKIFGEDAEAELRFYDREGFGADPNAYESVTFGFDKERFEKDMSQIAKAREHVKASGATFLNSGRPIGNTDVNNMPSNEDLIASMQTLKDMSAYDDSYNYSKMFSDLRNRSDGSYTENNTRNAAESARMAAQKDLHKKLSPKEYDEYLLPPKPAGGNSTKDLFTNLTLLHDQAKIYQKMKGLDIDDLSKFPNQIQKAITSTRENGPDYQGFIELTNKLRELDPKNFSFSKSIEAWKAHRAAVGDWMIKKIEDAENLMIDLRKSGDVGGSQQAYGTFENSTKAFQEYIRRGIGKKTDIYTDDRRFVYPALAQSAGVYMSPADIMKKVGEPLGDDSQLIGAYDKITKGLTNPKMTPPVTGVRGIFREFSGMNKEAVDLLNDAERLKRVGPEIIKAWDFDEVARKATRLREALQNVLKENGELDAEQKKNLQGYVSHLRSIENMYGSSPLGEMNEGGMDIRPVLRSESPDMQRAMNARNIQSIMKEYTKSSEEGGPKVGANISYVSKVMDSGQVVENNRFDFKKYGEEITASGEKVGKFSMAQVNLIEKMQTASSTFGNAIKRVIMWGAASNMVYSGVSYLSNSLDMMSKIESGMAELRMVMNTSTTDFGKMQKTAIGFGKQFGTPVPDVIKSMVIFAQQGLNQEEIIDRTRTATIAANVTTLNAKDATEALTAAMVVFREEGDRSLRFLDSWSEVEARHAITAGDMANAIKKSAAAAKVAGFTFDQLNGIVAAVGSTTRQSGNEIGTSMRFISRRLFTEDGPKALAKLPKSVSTITGTGENRSGFDILGDLAAQWKDLTEAQKLNVATSIGGTRQYNSLLVIMDQWDEVLRGLSNSMNAKGSSERRNAEIMSTYAKQMEQTKAAATELKMELSKIVLPTFKAGLGGFKFLLEAITAIPTPIKLAATGLIGLLGTLGKGLPIIDGIAEAFSKGGAAFDGFADSLSNQLKISKFEITGKGKDDMYFSTDGLKTVTKTEGKERGTKLSDFHSAPGAILYLAKEMGLKYNEFLTQLPIIFGAGLEKVGERSKSVGSFLSFSGDLVDSDKKKSMKDVIGTVGVAAEARGLGAEGVKTAFKGGPKALGKLGLKAAGFVTEVSGLATSILGEVIDSSGEYIGSAGHKMLKDYASHDNGLLKSLGPLLVTAVALAPAIKVAYGEFKKLNQSAQEFEDSMNGARQANADELKNIRDTITKYNTVDSKISDAKSASDPETKKRRMELGTYESPLVTMQKVYKESLEMTNSLAESNLNLVVGYDKLGNAVLKTSGSFKSYLSEMEKTKELSGLKLDVEVMDKYTKDLTEKGGGEKFKVALKELAEAFPVIGDLVGRNIQVAPAKALEMATDDINKRLNIKQKYPLSTAADGDIKRLQGVLKGARTTFNENYVGFETAYKKIVAPTNFKNFGRDEIESFLSSPEMMKAYELKVNVDPKFKVVKGVKATDVLGKEVLTAANPGLAGLLDVNSKLTTANIESTGIHSRYDKGDKAKMHSGDILSISGGSKLDMAGDQAIAKYKKNIDGSFEWVAEYFNTKTLKIEERPIDEIESMIDNIFPAKKIQEDLAYRLDSLNTFVAGASAGLVGIKPKDFKKDFNLGERFFSEIATTTLLQGDFGFSPTKGYGKMSEMSNFNKDIDELYFKPMEDLKVKMEVFDKAKLEGMDSGDFNMSKGSYEEIEKLLDVLKNNQVILQFRAVFVDLIKEFSEGERVLRQNLEVTKNRLAVERETSGFMKGTPKSVMDYQVNSNKMSDMTPIQSLLRKDNKVVSDVARVKELSMISETKLSQMDSTQKALVNLSEIRRVAKATGVSIDEKNIGAYVEKVAAEADESGPFKELNKSNTKIVDNTKDMIDRLDTLIENQGDPSTIVDMLSSITDRSFVSEGKDIASALERVAGIRDRAESKGQQDVITASNKALDQLTKNLVDKVGYKEGSELVGSRFNGNIISTGRNIFKDFTQDEFKTRALSTIDQDMLMSKMERYAPQKDKWYTPKDDRFKESDEYKNFKSVKKSTETDKPFVSANTTASMQAAIAAASYMDKLGKTRVSKRLDERINSIDEQIASARKSGKGEAAIRDLSIKQRALVKTRDDANKEAEFYGTVQALSVTGLAANELGMVLGLTEKQVKYLNIAAIGTYGAMVAASKAMGEDIPENAKKFGDELKKVTGKMMATGEMPTREDLSELRDRGGELQKNVNDRTKEIFGKTSSQIKDGINKAKSPKEAPDAGAAASVNNVSPSQGISPILGDYAKQDLKERNNKYKAEIEAYRSSSPEAAAYDDMYKKQQKEVGDLNKKQGGYNPGTDAAKDLQKKHGAEYFEWRRNISSDEEKRLTKEHPKYNNVGSYNEFIDKNYGSRMEKEGEIDRRGAEKDVGTDRLKQAIVAYSAAALTNYVNKKGSERVELATLESRMEKQNKALVDVLDRNPAATEKVLNEIYSKEKSKTGKEASTTTMVDKQLARGNDPEYNKMVDAINNFRKALEKEYAAAAKERAKIEAKLIFNNGKEDANLNARNTVLGEYGRQSSEKIGRRYSMRNVIQKDNAFTAENVLGEDGVVMNTIGKEMKNFAKASMWGKIKMIGSGMVDAASSIVNPKSLLKIPGKIYNRLSEFGSGMKNLMNNRYDYAGDVELPVSEQDMSTQQRLYTDSNKGFRRRFNAYADGGNVLGSMRTNMENTVKKISEQEEIIKGSKDQDTIDYAEKAHKELTAQLENETKAADNYAKKLRDFANSYSLLEKFAGAVYQLKNALRDMDMQDAVNNIEGMLSYKNNMNMLLGGSHPDAVQSISPEDERAGSRVGVNLRNLSSTKTQVEEARLKDQLSKATQPQDIANLTQQLRDLPERRRRELAAMEQQRYDEDLKRSTSIYTDQLLPLERAKNMKGMPSDVRDAISVYQESIAKNVEKANEKLSIEDYEAEHKADKRKVYSTRDKDLINLYNSESESIEKYKKEGYTSLYRDMSSGVRADLLFDQPENITDILKKGTAESGEGLLLQSSVTDKIVEAINKTNEILGTIADRVYGLETEAPDFVTKLVRTFGPENTPYVNMYSTPQNEKDLLRPQYGYTANKASGGYIMGPGTRTSDSIPAMLSNGEFVVKAASVEKIGLPNLNYLNSYGKIPGFADGGLVDSGIFGWMNRKASDGIDYLKNKRLDLAKTNAELIDSESNKGIFSKIGNAFETKNNMKQMGLLALGEIVGKIAKSPLDALSGIEGASAYVAKNGLYDTAVNMSKGIDSAKKIGLPTLLKSMASGVYNSLSEDLSTGGTGLTSGILGSLSGVGMSKYMKGTKLPINVIDKGADVAKGIDNLTTLDDVASYLKKVKSNNKVMGNIEFELPDKINDPSEILSLKAVIDRIDTYASKAPEAQMLKEVLTGEKGTSFLNKGYEKALVKGKPTGSFKDGTAAIKVSGRNMDKIIGTIDHEVIGHHFDNETSILRDALNSGIFKGRGMDEFLNARSDVDNLLRSTVENSMDRSAFPSKYAHEMALKSKMRGARETFAEAAAGKGGKDLQISSAVRNLRELTYDNKDVNSLMRSAYKNKDYMDFRSKSLADKTHILRFASGGYVEEDEFTKLDRKNPKNIGNAKWRGEDGVTHLLSDSLMGRSGNAEWSTNGWKTTSNIKNINVEDGRNENGLLPGEATWTFRGKTYKMAADGNIPGDRTAMYSDKGSYRGESRGNGSYYNYGNESSADNKSKASKWAHSSLAEANSNILESARGRGRVDSSRLPEDIRDYVSESYIGIGAQYDTDLFRESLLTKKKFREESESRRNRLEKSLGHYEDIRGMDVNNPEHIKAYGNKVKLDSRRQLVMGKGDLLAFQSTKDLRESSMDFSYNPMEHLSKGKGYVEKFAKDKQAYLKSDTGKRMKDGKLSYYMESVKEERDLAAKALATKGITEHEKKALQQQVERMDGVIQAFMGGADPFSDKFQTAVLLAMRGGTLAVDKNGKQAPMRLSSIISPDRHQFTEDSPQYGNIWSYILNKNLQKEEIKKADNSDLTGNTSTNPGKALTQDDVNHMIKEALAGKPDRVTSSNPMLGGYNSTVNYDNRRAKQAVNKLSSMGVANPEDMIEYGYADGGLVSKKSKAMEKLNSMLNRSAEVMHNGGIVHNDGLVFAQRGELFIPKGFASGGLVEGGGSKSVALASSASLKIDASDILDKLESIELKVEDKELKIENKVLKVEDKTFKVDAGAISIDVGEASAKLKEAISSALSRSVKVEVSGSGGSVGADKIDQLSMAVSKVSDRLVAVKNELDNKIKIAGSNNETIDIDRKISSAVNNKISEVNKDMNEIRNSVGGILSSQKQKEVYYQHKFDELTYKLSSAMNITGIGRGI